MRSFIYLISILAVLFVTGASMGPLVPALLADTIPARVKGDSLLTDSTGLLQSDSLEVVTDTVAVPDSFVVTGKVIRGTASFYSARFEGRRTANGEIFRNAGLTAASNHFKLNTLLRVTNLKNNKTVIVRVNDRMHRNMKKKGRVVDLTRNAASELGFIKNGLTKVKVEPVTAFAKKSMGISSE